MSPTLNQGFIVPIGALLLCSVTLAASQLLGQQLPADWQSATQVQSIQHQPSIEPQFTPLRQPITADLQNQVSALSAQLAAAQRKIQYFQQQLSLTNQQQLQQPQQQLQPPATPPVATSQHQVPTSSLQQLLQTQQAFYAQPQVNQQHQAQLIQQQQQQQQHQHQHQHQQQQQAQVQAQAQQPQVSTLIDPADLTNENQRFFYRPQQPQQPAQAPTSTTVGPPSIEPSLAAQVESQEEPQRQNLATQQVQPEPQQPTQQSSPLPVNHPTPPHNPPRNDDKFSIGLGVLSPGYTQKFGNTALDFNQDKDGFSFTLSNNGHNNQPQAPKPASTSSGNTSGGQ